MTTTTGTAAPPLYPLPASPGRNDLRDARRALAPLAAIGIEQAKGELAVVDLLIRTLYPRGAELAAIKGTVQRAVRRGRPKKRREILAADCPMVCGCGKTRQLLDATGRVYGPRGTPVQLAAAGKKPNPHCPRCKGTGVVYAPAEVDRAEFYGTWAHKANQKGRAPRGDVATGDGCSDAGRFPYTQHRRGYLGGEFIAMSSGAVRSALDWRGRRQSGTPLDFSAEAEGAAKRALSNPDTGLDWGVRGRRLVKRSRRDRGILTPGQAKRVSTESRVRLYRSIEARLNRAGKPRAPRVQKDAALEALARLGVDTSALKAQIAAYHAEQAQLERDQAVELPETAPEPFNCVIAAGPDAGRRGRVTLGLFGALVVRADGRTHRGAALRVEFPDGGFDVYHPGDVKEVAHA